MTDNDDSQLVPEAKQAADRFKSKRKLDFNDSVDTTLANGRRLTERQQLALLLKESTSLNQSYRKKRSQATNESDGLSTDSKPEQDFKAAKAEIEQKPVEVPKQKPSDFRQWSEAKQRAWEAINTNPNAYYYRNTHPGIKQSYGKWTEEQHQMFMATLKKHHPNNGQWGIFASMMLAAGRVGYQCRNYYHQLLSQGLLKDEDYMDNHGNYSIKKVKRASSPISRRRTCDETSDNETKEEEEAEEETEAVIPHQSEENRTEPHQPELNIVEEKIVDEITSPLNNDFSLFSSSPARVPASSPSPHRHIFSSSPQRAPVMSSPRREDESASPWQSSPSREASPLPSDDLTNELEQTIEDDDPTCVANTDLVAVNTNLIADHDVKEVKMDLAETDKNLTDTNMDLVVVEDRVDSLIVPEEKVIAQNNKIASEADLFEKKRRFARKSSKSIDDHVQVAVSPVVPFDSNLEVSESRPGVNGIKEVTEQLLIMRNLITYTNKYKATVATRPAALSNHDDNDVDIDARRNELLLRSHKAQAEKLRVAFENELQRTIKICVASSPDSPPLETIQNKLMMVVSVYESLQDAMQWRHQQELLAAQLTYRIAPRQNLRNALNFS